MRKNGFTLIELLSVIVILAIIALIAVPIVLGIIDAARKEANKRSVELYLSAVELAVMQKKLNSTFDSLICKIKSDGSGDLLCGAETVEVDVNGSVPTDGILKFDNGKIVSFKNIKINGVYARLGENNTIVLSNKLLSTSVCIAADKDTVTTGNIPQGNYENGDEYICEVKNGVFYHFFVVSTDGFDVNLIVDRNMTEQGPATRDNLAATAWASVEDYYSGLYPKISKECKADSSHTCYNSGPVTALNQLDKVVSSWTNIPIKIYVTNENPVVVNNPSENTPIGTWRYITDLGWPPYSAITRNTRARLLTVEEASANGCKFEYDDSEGKHYLGTCPLYMVNYTQFKDANATSNAKFNGKTKIDGVRGYWLSTSSVGYSTNGHCGIGIHDNAVLNCTYTSRNDYFGIRPVITLNKTDLGGKICTYTDVDNSDTLNLSDIVTCGSESFYVVENDETNVKMLAKYSLNLYSDDNTDYPLGIQYISAGRIAEDETTTLYRTDKVSYVDSEIEPYIESYKIYLEQNGLNNVKVTLMNYSQAINLRDNNGNPSWIYSGSYWINGGIINSDLGSSSINEYDATGFGGSIRPMVIISIDNL